MNWVDLVTDVGTGQLSHTKLWNNVANAAATGCFIYEVYKDQDSEWLWLIYLGVVGGSALVSKLLSMKYGGKDAQ
jgi:hypothetical protein